MSKASFLCLNFNTTDSWRTQGNVYRQKWKQILRDRDYKFEMEDVDGSTIDVGEWEIIRRKTIKERAGDRWNSRDDEKATTNNAEEWKGVQDNKRRLYNKTNVGSLEYNDSMKSSWI